MFQAGATLLRLMTSKFQGPWRPSAVTCRRLRPDPSDPLLLVKASLLLMMLSLVACLALVTCAAESAAWSPPRFPAQPTEVVIIGTRHSAQLEYEDHAPARIRALLNRIDPAAIGVETTPAWSREAESLGFPAESEPGLGNVISPVGNLTIRQRVLYELAQQSVDDEARRRARMVLENDDFNARQRKELRGLLGS